MPIQRHCEIKSPRLEFMSIRPMESQCLNYLPLPWNWYPIRHHSTLTKPNGQASNVRSDFVTCVNRKVGDANPIQICTNPSPLELHHASTWIMKILQSIRCHCKVTWLPLCLYLPPNCSYTTWLPSWHIWTVNLMPLRLQRDHHSNKVLPIKCHLCATVLSLSQIDTTQPI